MESYGKIGFTCSRFTKDDLIDSRRRGTCLSKGLSEALQLIKVERRDVPIDMARVRYRSQLVITKEANNLLSEAAELD